MHQCYMSYNITVYLYSCTVVYNMILCLLRYICDTDQQKQLFDKKYRTRGVRQTWKIGITSQ